MMHDQLKRYPCIILLAGGKESGKSTLAKQLWEWESKRNKYQNPPIVSFAKPLKNACINIWGQGVNFYESSLKGQRHPMSQHTPRTIMQSMGDAARELDPEIFVRKAIGFVQGYVRDIDGRNSVFIIDDLRLYLEADMFKRTFRHAYIIEVEGKGYEGEHDTEMPLSKLLIDYTIENDFSDNTIDNLYSIYQKILNIYKV